MSARAPVVRPLLHAATGLCALALAILPHPFELVAAGVGILAGWVVFPLTPLERKLRRPGEPFLCGLRTYPLAVFGLVWLLPRAEAAAAWGILAFGDAAAAIVGQTVRSPRVFGHGKATWAGSGAHVLAGFVAALGLSSAVCALADAVGWVDAEAVGAAPGIARVALAAGAAALMDLVPLPPDDNLPGALTAGVVLRATRMGT